MSYLNRVIKLILLAAFFIIFSTTKIEAQSGCCSSHGGVSHCASNGRKVCNDGTYSPSCYCSTAPIYNYTPPAPNMPDAQGNWEFKENKYGGIDMHFNWDRPNGRGYSITLNRVAGANPGPLSDTVQSEYIFKNVSPGTWYINVKENIDGRWSKVVYWTVNIPSNVEQVAIPYFKPSPTPTYKPQETISYTDNKQNKNGMNPLTSIALVAGVPSAIVYFGKNRKK